MIDYERLWERAMLDRGVERYLNQCDRAKVRVTDDGTRIQAKDESSTTYGISLIRRVFEPFTQAIDWHVKQNLTGKGAPSTAMTYLAACDSREVAYLAAKCVMDSITRKEKYNTLAIRIGTHVEDHMRFSTFDETHPKYFKTAMNALKDAHVSDYRTKRRMLVNFHNQAADPILAKKRAEHDAARLDMTPAETKALVAERTALCEQAEWISWPIRDRISIGAVLVDILILATSEYKDGNSPVNNCYHDDRRIQGTATIEKVNVMRKKTSTMMVVATEETATWIRENMAVCATLHPEYMPTLIPPKQWTTPYDGGFWLPQMRERRPLVKTSKKHLKALEYAFMPDVYDAVNAAQSVPWQVNNFVLDEAMAQWMAPHGIKMPGQEPIRIPENPLGELEQGTMSNKQFRAYKKQIRSSLTPDEKQEFAIWCNRKREAILRDKERVSKILNIDSTLRVARKLAQEDEFYYVHTLDYRGRLYPCGTGLNPQGTDLSKGLLKFTRGTPLGDDGFWHMCLHTAGVYGVDKVSLEDRVRWIYDNKQAIIRTGLDPKETQDFWSRADKPYMFLAVCEELTQVLMLNGKLPGNNCLQSELRGYASTFVSHLPGYQDGSCNGSQHFSAMLLDPVGAKATNMTAQAIGELPEDIYNDTCQVALTELREHLRRGLIRNGKNLVAITDKQRRLITKIIDHIDRKTTKRSTMIVPYGGTKRSCLKHVNAWVTEVSDKYGLFEDREIYDVALPLHHYVWHALDVVVIASRKAMKFLRDIVKVPTSQGMSMQCTMPTGFILMQDIKSMVDKRVDLTMFGRIRISYQEETDELNKFKMSTTFPPNFVHGMDATHCMLTVNASGDAGIEDFALVHDSFGVPFGHCELFHKIIRQQFVNIYRNNVLIALKKQILAQFPDLIHTLPADADVTRGNYDLNEVLAAIHFFR